MSELYINGRKVVFIVPECLKHLSDPPEPSLLTIDLPNARRFVGVLELPPLAPKDGVREWAVRGDWVR